MSILRRAIDSDWPSIKKLFKLNDITGHLDSYVFNKYWFNASAVNEWNIFLVEDDSSSVRGIMMSDINWNSPERILFTKGDGERDWPTSNDIRTT
jgi:hypothetical protein